MKNYIIEDQFPLQVSRGKVKGAYHVVKFGENLDVDGNMESIWDAGGMYPWSSFDTAGTVVLTSSSTEDDEDKGGGVEGTGAHRVQIEGLDNDFNLVSEVLITNGTANRTSTTEFRRVFRAFLTEAGTDGTNAGTITISKGGTTVAQIRIAGGTGLGQTFMSVYTVPAGYTGYIHNWDITSAKSDGDVFLMQRTETDGGVWTSKDVMHINQNNVERKYTFPLKVEEKTDIDIRAFSATNNMKVASTFCILLLKNDTPIPNGTGG